ncbi:MAG: hypothetical protein A2540_05285 [Sulfurimonas sp. RIFOXYD2_FULL_37_8]|jgi:uncharacterized protein with HEPN domain|nr:MAG: hypothetical protein A2540_05285 [Sulfurimonas sp. RIFOXYD2_FULL_37_8]
MSKIKFDLFALLEAIDKIKLYSQDFSDADTFYHDQKSFDATMMQFIVIGEIISRLDINFKKSNNKIPWQKIKDFRNIIAHDYFGIDADEIWDIINNKLLPFQNDIKILAESL